MEIVNREKKAFLRRKRTNTWEDKKLWKSKNHNGKNLQRKWTIRMNMKREYGEYLETEKPKLMKLSKYCWVLYQHGEQEWEFLIPGNYNVDAVNEITTKDVEDTVTMLKNSTVLENSEWIVEM